jgi:uncharacterized repeat protein (TIGR01451 family)
MISASHVKRLALLLCLAMCTCSAFAVVVAPPVIVKSFSTATVGLNLSTTLTFTITNPNGATDLTGVSFNDNMPAGLIIANPDSLTGTCDPGVITTAPDNINLVGATILAGSSCTFSVDVLAIATGNQVNTTDPVTSNEGGTGGTATATVSVITSDLTITSTHAGNFTRPQTGAIYTLTVTNSGGADTIALINVTDTLPAGLTATAIDGPNWICTLSPLGCTRGDTLFAGTSFEPITITVNVGNNAASSVSNTATVSGGGETNTANDSASDPTQIDAVLQMSAQTANLTVAAGGTASTTLNVNYAGGLGAITFACTGLPTAASCSFNPTSVSAVGTTPVTINITTTARTAAALPPAPRGFPPFLTALLALTGLAAVLVALTRGSSGRMRLATGLAGMALLVVSGCGSDSKPIGGGGPTGTPAGTSAVTVTATSASGGATATNTLNLTVQ